MRALVLTILALPLVAAGHGDAGPGPMAATDPVFVTFDPVLRTVHVGAAAGPVEGVEADVCSTASPVLLECTGVASPHAATMPPPVYLQALLYPRELVSLDGGTFDMWIEWANGTAGIRCTVPPTIQDPGALLGIVCKDIGTMASSTWPDEAWTFRARQDASLIGAVQATVVFDGSI